jgi:putative inorganic carbon (HCO3(-)) transporter
MPGADARLRSVAARDWTRLSPSATAPVLVGAAVAAITSLCVVIAYMVSPAIALALPVGAAVMALILVRPIYGIYIGILLAPLEYLTLQLGGLAGLSLSEAVLLITAGSTVAHAAIDQRRWRTPALAHLAFAALILVAATGLIFAPDPTVVAKVVLMWTTYLILSLLVASSGVEDIRRLFTVVAVSGGILGAMAIPKASGLQVVGGGETVDNRATASFNHPNILAFFLVLALAPTLALALRSRGRMRPAMIACAVLILGGLLVTLSRGAIIGAAVSLAIMLLLPAFRRVVGVGLVVLVVAGLAGSATLADSPQATLLKTRLSTIGYESQTNPRLEIYRVAPSIVAAHPFLGIGEANFVNVAGSYGLRDIDGSVFEHAHDVLLTVAVETGLIGLAAFVTFLGSMVQTMMRVLRRRRDEEWGLALGLTAALSGLFVNGLTDYPLRANLVMALIMCEAGALIAYGRRPAPVRD